MGHIRKDRTIMKIKKSYTTLLIVPMLLVGLSACGTSSKNESSVSAETYKVVSTDISTKEKQVVETATTIASTTTSESISGTTIDLSKETGETVEITKSGTYTLTGTYTGQIHINADKADVTLILKGAKITSKNGPAIYAEDADKATLSLVGENTVSDSSNYRETEPANAAIYAQDSLIITGEGALTVEGNYEAGIRTKDDLVIDGGNITVEATTDAVKATDTLTITGGMLNLTAGNDGIQASGTDPDQGMMTIAGGKITISASKQGVQATNKLEISGGELTVKDSYEGAAAANIVIKGGKMTVYSTDDGLNASSDTSNDLSIEITDGELNIYAGLSSQGDGLDSNGTITISGGTINIYDPSNAGDWSSVDSETGTTLTGGTVTKISSSGEKIVLTEETIQSQGPGGMGRVNGGSGRF